MSSNKSDFFIFLKNFFLCIYKNVYKDSSAKYYQDNEESLQKKACERYPNLSKEEEKKANIWLWTIQKSTRRWKTKAGCVQKKMLQNEKKHLTIIIINYFHL